MNTTPVIPKKPLPVIVTFVPTGPLVGLKDVIVGALTVKFVAEVVLPTVFVIVIGPLVAPLQGTRADSCVSDATPNPRDKPFKVTDVAPVKLLPLTVISVPGGPLVGEKALIVGGAEESTVNFVLEMASLLVLIT